MRVRVCKSVCVCGEEGEMMFHTLQTNLKSDAPDSFTTLIINDRAFYSVFCFLISLFKGKQYVLTFTFFFLSM